LSPELDVVSRQQESLPGTLDVERGSVATTLDHLLEPEHRFGLSDEQLCSSHLRLGLQIRHLAALDDVLDHGLADRLIGLQRPGHLAGDQQAIPVEGVKKKETVSMNWTPAPESGDGPPAIQRSEASPVVEPVEFLPVRKPCTTNVDVLSQTEILDLRFAHRPQADG
jgi:hypothetical protein